MKIIQLIITIIASMGAALITSIALQNHWIQEEISRMIIIYLLMAIELLVGFLVIREILKN